MIMNCCIIGGRFTADPELKQTTSGKSVCTFSLAVYGGKDKTVFADMQAWDKCAESISRLYKKGDSFGCKARFDVREWTDKEGNKRKAAQFIVEQDFYIPKRTEPKEEPKEEPRGEKFEAVDLEGGLPF